VLAEEYGGRAFRHTGREQLTAQQALEPGAREGSQFDPGGGPILPRVPGPPLLTKISGRENWSVRLTLLD
jgi:hypothetical protein